MDSVPSFIVNELEKQSEQKSAEANSAEKQTESSEQKEGQKSEEKLSGQEEKKTEVSVFDFKSIDERITSAEDVKKYLTERDTYFSELEDTKTKLSQYNGYIKPNSDFVAKLNELEAKGGNVDLFLQMRTIDPQSLKEDEAVKLMLQFQDGLTSQGADRKVKILYKLGKDISAIQGAINEAKDSANEKFDLKEASRLEDELESIYMAQDELKANGKKAKEFLSTLKVESQKVPDVEGQINQIRESWKPNVPKFIPKDITVPFKVENPDKTFTDLNVKFALEGDNEKNLKEFLDATVEYFASKGIAYDEEKAMKLLPNDVKNKILGDNFEVIANRMVNTAIEAERARVKTAIHAPNKETEKTESKGEEQDEATKLFFNTIRGARNGR